MLGMMNPARTRRRRLRSIATASENDRKQVKMFTDNCG
jgi:hypothetical protein